MRWLGPRTKRIEVVHRTDPADPATERLLTIDTESRAVGVPLIKDTVEQVAIIPVPAGAVSQIRFVTSGVTLVVDGLGQSVKLPSGEQTGLKINAPAGLPFVVHKKEATLVEAQFDPNRQLNHNKGQGFMLKPTLEAITVVQNREQPTGIVPDRVQVKFAPGTSRAAIDAAIAAKAATIFQEGPALFFILNLSYPTTIAETLEYLNGRPDVLFALPDFYLIDRQAPPEISAPNDPAWVSAQRFVYSTSGGGTSPGVGGLNAWFVTQGSHEVVVAVIELGFDIDHPDIMDNVFLNEGELPANFVADVGGRKAADCNEDGLVTFGDLNCRNCTVIEQPKTADQTCRDTFETLRVAACARSADLCIPQDTAPSPAALLRSIKDGDSDGNGKPDDLIGWDFDGNDNDPSILRADTNDDNRLNHGMEMAGMIGAVANNSIDVVGTAWRVRLALIRTKTDAENRNALRYAAETLRANVINYSRGLVFLSGKAPPLVNQPPEIVCPVSSQNTKQELLDSKLTSYQTDFRQIDLSKTLLVAAMSNCPMDVDDPGVLEWPGEADSPSVLTVTTSSSASAFGATTVDTSGLGGPGRSLKHRVSAPTGTTSQSPVSGDSTSFAAAYVSGVAALVLSAFPDLRDRPECLRALLMRNGRGGSAKAIAGSGRVHMFDAVTNATPAPTPDGCPR